MARVRSTDRTQDRRNAGVSALRQLAADGLVRQNLGVPRDRRPQDLIRSPTPSLAESAALARRQVEVEVVAVRLVGIGAQDGAEGAAGALVQAAQEGRLGRDDAPRVGDLLRLAALNGGCSGVPADGRGRSRIAGPLLVAAPRTAGRLLRIDTAAEPLELRAPCQAPAPFRLPLLGGFLLALGVLALALGLRLEPRRLLFEARGLLFFQPGGIGLD